MRAVGLLGGDDALGDEALAVERERRRVRGDLRYMTGCVKVGSSSSLWPCRR